MKECSKCNGIGVVFIGCCSGFQCGCMGYPVIAKKCKCGNPTNESLMSEDELLIFNNVEYQEEIK